MGSGSACAVERGPVGRRLYCTRVLVEIQDLACVPLELTPEGQRPAGEFLGQRIYHEV